MILGLALVDWLVVLGYMAGIAAIGLYSRRSVRSTGDYFMGGRRFGKLLMIAQAFGSGTRTDQAVAVIGASSQIGLAGIWYQWLYIFSTPFFWIIAPIYRRMRYITIGDFFEQRYGTGMGAAYAFTGLLYFAANIGIGLKGTGLTIEAVTGGAVSTNAAVIGMVLFFLAYGVLGGLVAAVKTQFVQGFFILLLSFLLIPFALHEAGGLGVIRSTLPQEMFSLFATTEVTLFFVIMAVLNALVGVVVQPHHMAINGAGKDELSCRTGWTYGNIVKRFATLGWAFTGIFLAVLFPVLATASGAEREMAFGMAVASLLPVGFVGLMLAAIIAAGVAVCNAFMVNGAALFTRNFYVRFLEPGASEARCMTVARASSVGVVVVGVVVALYIPSVVDGLLLIWKIMAFLGIAFWVGIIWRRANRYGAWTSMLLTAAVAFGMDAAGASFAEQVAVYLPIGFASIVLVSLLTPSEDANRLNTFYSLLRTPVGHEDRLREAGIEMIHEGGADEMQTAESAVFRGLDPGLADSGARSQTPEPLEKDHATSGPQAIPLLPRLPDETREGQGLLIADLLELSRLFSFRRYRTDIRGFGSVWVIVLGIIVLAWLTARLVAGA